MSELKKLIFIDRDGVINVDLIGDYIKRWEDFRFEEGALRALRRITVMGFDIILISNQAGIGDGLFEEKALWNTHRLMLEVFQSENIKIYSSHYCVHGKKAGCACRKPKTGLFEEATKGLTFNKKETFFIGDKLTDVQAGHAFGLQTIFVRTGHGKADEPKLTGKNKPTHIADNLEQAVNFLSP